MPKPKILEIIAEMREQGMSDEEIIANLKQLGLSDEEIKKIMEIADRDVYSKFKREMAVFVQNQLKRNKGLIEEAVSAVIGEKLGKIKKELGEMTDEKMGEMAKIVNEKTKDMEALAKSVREENLGLSKEVRAMRADVDLLLAGPTKVRLALAAFFMLVGVIIVLYSIVAVTPNVIALNFPDPMSGAILLATGGMYVIFGIISMMVGLHLYGKPS